MLKPILGVLLTCTLLTGCSGGSSNAANDKVCSDVAEIMQGSGYMQGTRESLRNATIELAFYQPDSVDDWVTYVSPAEGSYEPSLNDNDNAIYQNLYRLQEKAIEYVDSLNAGAFYNEWEYFQEGCGFPTE